MEAFNSDLSELRFSVLLQMYMYWNLELHSLYDPACIGRLCTDLTTAHLHTDIKTVHCSHFYSILVPCPAYLFLYFGPALDLWARVCANKTGLLHFQQ